MSFVVAAVSAVGTAIATTTVLTVATAVAYVGAAMTVVGTVTKSKELVKIGGKLSLAGGIVSLAAGAYGALASEAGGAAASGAAGGAASTAGDAAFDAWAADMGAAEAGVGVDAFGGTSASWEGAISSGGAATEGLASSQSSGLLGSSTDVAQQGVSKFGEPVRQFGDAAAEQSMAGEVASAVDKIGAVAPPPATDPGSIGKWWSELSDPVKNRILSMGERAAGSLFQGWTQEQKMAFDREKFNLEQQKYNTSVSNASAQPTTIKPLAPAGGLINARRG